MATKLYGIDKKTKSIKKYTVSNTEKAAIDREIEKCKSISLYNYYKLYDKKFVGSKIRPYNIPSGYLHYVSQICYQSLKGGNKDV